MEEALTSRFIKQIEENSLGPDHLEGTATFPFFSHEKASSAASNSLRI